MLDTQNMNSLDTYQYRRAKVFYRIFIFEFILFFFGIFTTQSVYGLYLVAYFALMFNTYIITHFLFTKYRYNRIFAVVLVYSFFSCCIGLMNSWELKDVLGDSARFLAPFLAYTLGMMLLKDIEINKFKTAMNGIIRVLIISSENVTEEKILFKVPTLFSSNCAFELFCN